MSLLNRSRCKVEFNQKRALIYDAKGKLIVSGDQTRGNLFYLDASSEACLIVRFDYVWLWHNILCHVNFDNLVSISKMRKLRGLPKLKKLDNVTWKQNQLGKTTKSSFKSKNHTPNEILELV